MQRDNWTLDHDLEADSMILTNGEITINFGKLGGIYSFDFLDADSNCVGTIDVEI